MGIEQTQHIHIGHSEIELRTDSIIQIKASSHTYTVKDVKEIHAAIKELVGSQKSLLLFIAGAYTSINADVREYLSTDEAGDLAIAKAFVIKSLAQRLLLNFLIKVNGTPVPTQFFTETEAAIDWLTKCNKAKSW